VGPFVTTSLPPAILLGGDRIAVSAARSLARTGVRVLALGHRTDAVRWSRACARFVDVGAGDGLQERYLDWLRLGPHEGVLLPCDDDALELIARNRAALSGWGYLPVEANDEAVLVVLDKERTYALAGSAGVGVPATIALRTPADIAEAARSLRYPCALKPRHSHVFARRFGVRAKVVVVGDAAQLCERATELRALGIELLATEIVPGGDDSFCSYYTYIDEGGAPLFHFTKRKLRQWPIHFGLICYQVTNWQPEVAAAGLRFVTAAGVRGVANVEFKQDARDGCWRLIECNHRFTAANELVRAAGIDIPLLAYNRLAGRGSPVVSEYRRGVRMWDPVEDMRALQAYRRTGELTVRAWVRSLLHRQRFALLRLDDPLPSVAKTALHAPALVARYRVGRAT